MTDKKNRNYSEADLPELFELVDQTENFVLVRSPRLVYPNDLEQILSIGLSPCGITPSSWGSSLLMLRKE